MVPEHSRNRKAIRLKEYDYSLPGGYFITICTFDKQWLFGNIVHEEMQLNACGEIVQEEWKQTPALRPEILLDEYMVMPNHFHGIVIITDEHKHQNKTLVGTHGRASLQRTPRSLSSLVAGFKSVVTKRINEMNHTPRMPVWQPRFYEHVIRGEKDLNNIRRYILANPAQWQTDDEYPQPL
jgi:putative transposase